LKQLSKQDEMKAHLARLLKGQEGKCWQLPSVAGHEFA
jgi:hypothetical protein